jgi:hypothetical protein
MNIKASVRSKCPCCTDEFINVPLDVDDLVMGDDGENPDLQLSIDEANELIFKLQKLVKV